MEHYIETEGRPVSSKYRCLYPDCLAAAKAEFATLEKQGVVRRSSSNWASPLHMVKKPDGTWRLCGDFRRLNLQTEEDRYMCPNIADLTAQLASSALHVHAVQLNKAVLWCDYSMGVVRPLVPTSCRRDVFESLHQLAHPGMHATRRLIGACFVWHGMAKDITEWLRECQQCARGKILTHVKSQVVNIPVPSTRFLHVHLDIVGPFPKTPDGHTHLITMIDRTTRWPEVSLLQSITAVECADAFVATWVA
jgi:Integrase zinc binding domain